MILLVDNYDSFTFNIYQYLGSEHQSVKVLRNDQLKLDNSWVKKFKAIVISPGPGRPENAGIIVDIVKKLSGKIPILGVCLGCQAIAYAFGGKIVHAKQIFHGRSSIIEHTGKKIFRNISNPTTVARYHSLMAEVKSLPECLDITATSREDDCIMAIEHKQHLTFGIQFHPESVLTPAGKDMIKNFLKIC